MNCPKLIIITNSGIISMINAHLFSFWLFYSTHSIPALLYLLFISSYNKVNGTTTTITPIEHNAGNINNKLLPPPISIIAITLLYYHIIIYNTGS